jgi:signal transduction histidine kinase
MWTVSRDVADELQQRGDPRLAELARRLRTAAGAETEAFIQDAQDAAGDAIDGIRRVEELLHELRALSGAGPTSPSERLDVVRLLGAWSGPGALPRPVQLDVAAPVYASVGREDLEASVGRILNFLCEATPARQEGERALRLRAGYEAASPCIWIEDPLLELSETRRAEIFDPRIQADSRGGRTMRLNLGLALAWRLLRRMGADLAVSQGSSGGSVFRLLLPAAD